MIMFHYKLVPIRNHPTAFPLVGQCRFWIDIWILKTLIFSMETRSKNNCRVIVASNPGCTIEQFSNICRKKSIIALWFGFINWVNNTKLSCYTPQQMQLHHFSRNLPPLLMTALALPQSLTFSAKLVPIRNHPTAFTPFIHDCFSFA